MSLFNFGPLCREPKTIIMEGSHPVSGGHSIHYEVRGNNAGKPVLFIHGGPGRGIENSIWNFFNPKKYRIILVDQRGCGKSTPHGSVENNDTWSLIEDFESIRVLLGVDKWMLFGCGFGSFLALLYAQKHPTRVSEIIANNTMTNRDKEIAWLFGDGGGASQHLPMEWRRFRKPVENVPAFLVQRYYRLLESFIRGGTQAQWTKPIDHHTLIKRYYRLLTSDKVDEKERHAAVEAWTRFENAISGDSRTNAPPKSADDDQAYVVAKIAIHFFHHQGFLDDDNQVLDNMHIIREHKIKGVLVHGQDDQVNPIANALDLSEAWPEAHYIVVPNAGHSTRDTEIQRVLVQATDDFAGCGCLFPIHKKEVEVKHPPPFFP